jgi:hypothetical protein
VIASRVVPSVAAGAAFSLAAAKAAYRASPEFARGSGRVAGLKACLQAALGAGCFRAKTRLGGRAACNVFVGYRLLLQ